MLGVGYEHLVKTNQYGFNWDNIGHGLFVIADGGWSYSHSNED
jgi:hypothetical protein